MVIDREGRPRIHYTLSKRDEASMLKVGAGWRPTLLLLLVVRARCRWCGVGTWISVQVDWPLLYCLSDVPLFPASAQPSNGGHQHVYLCLSLRPAIQPPPPLPPQGMELGLRSMAAAGAETVMTLLAAPTGRFNFADASGGASSASDGTSGGAQSPAQRVSFEEFIAGVHQTGVVPLQLGVFCAHQMGTARLGEAEAAERLVCGFSLLRFLGLVPWMTSLPPSPMPDTAGVDPHTSVQDPSGECWEVAGLHCLDGSAFPTPTGVNPMVSVGKLQGMGRCCVCHSAREQTDGCYSRRASDARKHLLLFTNQHSLHPHSPIIDHYRGHLLHAGRAHRPAGGCDVAQEAV